MARIARIVVPGVPHLLTQRGNRGWPTFFGPADYRLYRRLVAAGCRRAGTTVLAYCLMPNHVHFLLVPQHGDGLRGALAEAHRRYTRHINERNGWRGHLWEARFASCPLDEPYVDAALRYVDEKPVRAGLAGRARDWAWSSARARDRGRAHPFVELAPPAESTACAAADLAASPLDALRRHARTGRPLGNRAFVRRAEAVLGSPVRAQQREVGHLPRGDGQRPGILLLHDAQRGFGCPEHTTARLDGRPPDPRRMRAYPTRVTGTAEVFAPERWIGAAVPDAWPLGHAG